MSDPKAGTPPIEQLDKPPPISAELRAEILSDPNIEKIAAELRMDLETFVNTIGFFMNNPGAEPALLTMSDENLRKLGFEPPTMEAVEANVRQSVAVIKAGQAPSGFEGAPTRKGVELTGSSGELVQVKEVDPSLQESIKKRRTPGKF